MIDQNKPKSRQEDENTFFDAHMHAYNLAHPSLGAMFFRVLNTIRPEKSPSERGLSDRIIGIFTELHYENRKPLYKALLLILGGVFLIAVIVLSPLLYLLNVYTLLASIILFTVITFAAYRKLKPKVAKVEKLMKAVSNAINLLFVMDYTLGEYFLELEEEMIDKGGRVTIHMKAYDKVALSPLMMDFSGEHDKLKAMFERWDGARQMLIDLPFYLPRDKGFIFQEFDLLNGIGTYYRKSKRQLFEFYPFRGIEFHEKMTEPILNQIYYEHFDPLPTEGMERRRKITEDLHRFPTNATMFHKMLQSSQISSELLMQVQSLHRDACIYAGFKVYGPMGFDAWPDDLDERELLKRFYRYCVKKNLPIVAHCGGPQAGTVLHDEYLMLTSPKRWEEVFAFTEKDGSKPFAKLKVDFAHFGRLPHPDRPYRIDDLDEWTLKIVSLMKQYENVYADISCYCYEEDAYPNVIRLIELMAEAVQVDLDLIYSRTIFGTDFPMTCFTTASYKAYLSILSNESSQALSPDLIKRFCVDNPRKFIFDY